MKRFLKIHMTDDAFSRDHIVRCQIVYRIYEELCSSSSCFILFFLGFSNHIFIRFSCSEIDFSFGKNLFLECDNLQGIR